MSYIGQIIAAKLPVLAGAGILGVSVAGACAALAGLTFTLEAEVISAVAGMATAGYLVARRKPK